MYSQIDSNRRKSWLLIALFTGVLALAGYAYGYVTRSGWSGLIFALAISVGLSLISFYAGDKIVLATTGAKEVTHREQNSYVWNIVENLAITSGIPRPRLYLIDDPAPNAFATGRDPAHASVAVTSGIIRLLENEELEGVIAHELSHVKNLDTRLMLLVAVLVGSLTLLGDLFIRSSLGFRGRDRDREGGHALFMAIGILALVVSPLVGQLIKLAVSRRREYLADASGALLTRYPEGLARALEKINRASEPIQSASYATAHLWIASPFAHHGFRSRLAALFSTHPPIHDRIRALRHMASPS